MKAFKYIAGLLLISFFAYLGHDLIPHHHRSEVFHSPLTSSCTFEHDQQHHDNDAHTTRNANTDHHADKDAKKNPFHCHAFNDVVFKKYSTPSDILRTGHTLALMVSGHLQTCDPPLETCSSVYHLSSVPCSLLTSSGTRALRAPPAQA